MLTYEGTLYRPPSEADSLILQATIGCSYNECGFCAMYREKRFRIRKIEEIYEEIEEVVRAIGDRRGIQKVFLADGDALIAKPSYLMAILERLNSTFPALRRVSCYASPQSLQVRKIDEMKQLREAGLTQYYLGVESGDDEVLLDLKKGVDAAEMIRVANKANEAGIKLSTMILLGAGGRSLSRRHAEESARVINAIQPRFLSTLVMTPVPGTPLGDRAERQEVDVFTPLELTQELKTFLELLELRATIFRSNHASNYLPLAGTFPKDKADLLRALEAIISREDDSYYRPETWRGL